MSALRWCFILFQCVWLNVVLPGHTRGVVTLAGTDESRGDSRSVAARHECCGGGASRRGDEKKSPTPSEKSRCAICFFAANVAPPAPLINPITELRLRQTMPAPAAAVAASVARPVTYLGRGPPLG
ncbi:MAG: hypothetical protein QOF78_2871 [Phycisphaerales bacterium]|jgi:hypothetical protein|nr:hypothetical protein [Phycisphaerales bacterium]